MWKASWDSGGWGGVGDDDDIPQPKMWSLGEPKHYILIFGVLSWKSFFQYNKIISTSKLPFHNPLVMKYYNVFSIFSLDYEKCPISKFIAYILYLSNTHKLHGPWLGVLYAWMNGYSTWLHNIAPGKYIGIKVEYGLQLHFKIFLKKSDRKNNNKNNH